jgi:hypothetical protein
LFLVLPHPMLLLPLLLLLLLEYQGQSTQGFVRC